MCRLLDLDWNTKSMSGALRVGGEGSGGDTPVGKCSMSVEIGSSVVFVESRCYSVTKREFVP